jgi:hypothetical protein
LKERILIPPMLQPKIEGLVRKHAKALKTTEADARRVVEVSIIQAGIAALEQETEGPA